jgi:hypothetical protein
MKRILGLSFAMFIALVAIALVGGDSGAVAGHGCHGRARSCHGGLLAKLHSRERCHGLFGHKKRGCHGAAAAPAACESGCGAAVESSGYSSCGGGEAVESSSGCTSCGGGMVTESTSGCSSCGGGEMVSGSEMVSGGEAVSGGCVGGGCEGGSVIMESAAPVSEGVPTEAAPVAPAAPAAT